MNSKKNIKILFTGDLYRGDQKGNIQKLYDILSPLFIGICSIDCLSSMNENKQFCWEDSIQAKVDSVFETLDLPQDNTVIIGFELSSSDIKYFTQKGIPWYNFEIEMKNHFYREI